MLDKLGQRIVIEQAEVVFWPQQADLRMMHAYERSGARETFAPKIDLRLIPDVKPILSRASQSNLRQCRFARTGKSLKLVTRSWVIRMLTEAVNSSDAIPGTALTISMGGNRLFYALITY